MSDAQRQKHPRHGYAVALFYGISDSVSAPESVLVEVHESYNVWGQSESKTYHYDVWDLGVRPKVMEAKTIGHIFFDPEGKEPPSFVVSHVRDANGQAFRWRRLR